MYNNITWRGNNTGHVQVRCQFISRMGGSMWASRELVTYSTEQGPSLAANRLSAIQKSPAFYGTWWFITAYTRARHLFLPWARSHQSILPSNFLKIHLHIILPSMPGSSKWFFSLRFPHPNPAYISALPHTCYMPRQSHSSLFYHPNNIRWGVHIAKLLVMWL